jgi:integrase
MQRIRSEMTGQRDRALILTMRMTGCRVSEVLALTPRHVDFTARRIVVPGTKTKASRRIIVLPTALAEALQAWLEQREHALGQASPDGPLFPNLSGRTSGQHLSRFAVNNMLRRRAAKAGLEGRVHPHAFRHGLAADLVRGEAPLAAVMAQLGHADLKVTSRYVGQLAADQAAEAAMSRLFETP